MIKQKPHKWMLAIIAFAAISCIASVVIAITDATAKTMEEVYPQFSEGILKSAKLEKMDNHLLLKADGFEIKDSFLEKTFGNVNPQVRKQLEKNMLFLLDQEVMEQLIKQDAKAMGIDVESPSEENLHAYFDRATKDVTVSDKAAKSFYDENQAMVGGMPFDQVKESIKGFLLQKERQDALQKHIEGLAKKARMRINEDWAKKQMAIAQNNPLDRARLSGKPTMVQFSSSGCAPCEMMKPILKKLKKKYEGSINFVSIPVNENQMLAGRYNVRAVPVQVFFDEKGKKVRHHMGFMAEAEILKQLKKMGAL